MNDKDLETLLHDTLATDVGDDRLFCFKKSIKNHKESNNMKVSYILKPAIAIAACAALVLGVSKIPDINTISQKGTNTATISEEINKAFTISALAASQKKNVEADKAVAVSTTGGEDGDLWFGDHSTLEIGYSIGAPLVCDGESIESITYSINHGNFMIVSPADDNFVTDGKKIDVDFGIDFTPDGLESKNDDRSLEITGNREIEAPSDAYDVSCYTSYTVSADRQTPSDGSIRICDVLKTDKSTFSKLWDFEDLNTLKEGRDELFKDLVITCDVTFTDGTTATKKIRIGNEIMKTDNADRYSLAVSEDNDDTSVDLYGDKGVYLTYILDEEK